MTHSHLSTIATAALLAGAASMASAQSDTPVEQGEPNLPDNTPAFPEQNRAPASDSGTTLAVEELAGPLEHPWGVAVLPEGGFLVTERPGRLRHISPEGDIGEPIAGVPEVLAESQGGLLDVATGPDFANDRVIFWTYAKPLGDGMSATAAARGVLSEDHSEVTEVEDIFVQEPPSPSPMHYGARIVFDGEGHVFITTGEHFTEEERLLAQDLGASYGKVIRLGLDGSVPQDNPFVDQEGALDTIWSYGHRNIQAAAIDPATGEFWLIEHGPQGGDELNLIEPGSNYGWPEVTYGENYDATPVGSGFRHEEPFVEPRYYWDPVIAPSGMVFHDGGMFADWQGDALVGSLTPGALVRLEIEGDMVTGEERLLTDRGRIRDVAIDSDGAILVITDAPEGALLRLTQEGEGAGAADAESSATEAGTDAPEPETDAAEPETDAPDASGESGATEAPEAPQ